MTAPGDAGGWRSASEEPGKDVTRILVTCSDSNGIFVENLPTAAGWGRFCQRWKAVQWFPVPPPPPVPPLLSDFERGARDMREASAKTCEELDVTYVMPSGGRIALATAADYIRALPIPRDPGAA